MRIVFFKNAYVIELLFHTKLIILFVFHHVHKQFELLQEDDNIQ